MITVTYVPPTYQQCANQTATCWCNGQVRYTNGVTTYGPVNTTKAIQCVYTNFPPAPSTAVGAAWTCQCLGTQPTCNYPDPIGGDQQLYVQNYSLFSYGSSDPWFDQTSNAVHRSGPNIYFGDVYGPPLTGIKNVTGFPGYILANADNFGPNDGFAGDPTGGNYVIVEGYIGFPAYAKTVTLQMNFNSREFYATFHIALAQNGSVTRDRNDWKQVMRKKANFGATVIYDSGPYTVPSCLFGQWVSFANVISDGTQAYEVILQWSINGGAFVNIPTTFLSSTKVNPVNSDCAALYCQLYAIFFVCSFTPGNLPNCALVLSSAGWLLTLSIAY